jgi:predicted exporter
LDTGTRSLLESGNAEIIARDALAGSYGAFTITPLENIEQDPFLLTEREMRNFLSSTLISAGALSVRNDVLCAEYQDTWFVMLRGGLTKAGASISKKENAVRFLYEQAESCEKQNPGTKIYFSGVPFHSSESSANAQKEISIISGISFLLIIVIFLLVFHSFIPLCVSALAVALSVAAALAGCFLFFREMHIITLIFGTTLIGICIDYSIHYFTHLSSGENTGRQPNRSIGRAITMGFISTEICFIILLFAPFDILKQFAVFSIFGMASSYLSVLYLYPVLLKKNSVRQISVNTAWIPKGIRYFRNLGTLFPHGNTGNRLILLGIILCSVVIITAKKNDLRIRNDIRSLYTMSPVLQENEKTVSAVLDYGSAPWYYIVSGGSEQAVLEQEEKLCAMLENEVAEGGIRSFTAVSLFVPSIAAQKKNYSEASKLTPFAEEQFKALGFPAGAGRSFIQDFDGKKDVYLSLSSDAPPYLKDILSTLWIGEIDGYYYSCVLPVHPVADASRFQIIAGRLDSVYMVNKIAAIGESLNALTKMILRLYLAAYIVIAVIIKIFYSWRDAIKICALPVILGLVTVSILLLLDIPVGFFCVGAFVLVLGLGLDYIFYIIEGGKNKNEATGILAIILSFITTALSFGALVLSNFAPVHIFGLVMFSGLITAFFSAFLLRKL